MKLTLDEPNEGELTIRGGTGKYALGGILAKQRHTRTYFDPQKIGSEHAQIELWETGHGCSLEEQYLCDDVELVLWIVEHFAKKGTFFPGVKWKCV